MGVLLTARLQEVSENKGEAAASTDPRVWAWGEMQQSLSGLQQQLVDYTTEEKLQPYLNPNYKVRLPCCSSLPQYIVL
jgi:hypothetical protein